MYDYYANISWFLLNIYLTFQYLFDDIMTSKIVNYNLKNIYYNMYNNII